MAAQVLRTPDLTSGSFLVLVDGMEPMTLTAVTGIGFELAVLEDHEAMIKPGRAPNRSPGVERHGVVTLSTMELEKAFQLGKWRSDCEDGRIDRRQVVITMMDSAGIPVQAFTLEDAWPSAVAINSVPQAGEGWMQIDFSLAWEHLTRERR